METHQLTQAQLAQRLGVHPSTIGNYLYGNREPDAAQCLLLAGLATDDGRHFFIERSRLGPDQLALIAEALKGVVVPDQKRKTG